MQSYVEQYQYIVERIQREEIRPIKTYPLNGKKPALHQNYWVVEKEKDYSELCEELKFRMPTSIITDYYLKNLKVYEKERNEVLLLGKYLKNQIKDTRTISMNERSFQIWGQEKLLQKGKGKTILKHCGLSMEDLNIYQTTEPLTYYTVSKQVPQNILIIENKDTFYSMRRYLIEKGNDTSIPSIFGYQIHTLVYGAGKGILRSIEDFKFCVEPYMNDSSNQYLYFGDLDYEGIGIYEQLSVLFEKEHEIVPFTVAYEKMIQKAEQTNQGNLEFLPDTKEGQNRNISKRFYNYFDKTTVGKMKRILQNEKYIPQECLNITDF